MLTTAYADAVERVAAIAETIDEGAARRAVPATPAWTVHDLLAHLAGGANDRVTGRLDGAPGRAWTNRQVVERRTATPSALAAELREYGAQIPAEALTAPGPTPAWDLLVHEADLREALDLPRAPEDTWRLLLPEVTAVIGSRPGTGGFEVRTEDGAWRIGTPVRTITVTGGDYELLRILFSRRSTEQIARVSDGADLLEQVALFGPRAA